MDIGILKCQWWDRMLKLPANYSWNNHDLFFCFKHWQKMVLSTKFYLRYKESSIKYEAAEDTAFGSVYTLYVYVYDT